MPFTGSLHWKSWLSLDAYRRIVSETKLAAVQQWLYSISNVSVNTKYKRIFRFYSLLLFCTHLKAPVTVVYQHTGYWQCLSDVPRWNPQIPPLCMSILFPLSRSWAAIPRELLRAVQFHWDGFRTGIYHHLIQHCWNLMHFWSISSGPLFYCSLHCSPCWLGGNWYQVCSVPGDSTSMHPKALCPLLWMSRCYWFWPCLKQRTKNYFCPCS